MRNFAVILILATFCACTTKEVDSKLSSHLSQIQELKYFNNSVVVYVDSVSHYFRFPYWNAQDVYYLNDVTRFKYCSYEALADSLVGQKPDVSPDVWRLIHGPHPFLYLKDTAQVSDLRILLNDKHPYIRTYAFAALSYRNEPNLLEVIVDNLKDTTKMLVFTGDLGVDMRPVELMIQYEHKKMQVNDKERLKYIISTHYPSFLKTFEELKKTEY